MFVQMFTAEVADAEAVRAVLEGWSTAAGRDAAGWLGTTAGITDDGRLVVLARFESEEVARANSDRPEQGRWWDSLAAHFKGEASFFDSDDVDADIVGDPDAAGFVQPGRRRLRDGGLLHLRGRRPRRRDQGATAGGVCPDGRAGCPRRGRRHVLRPAGPVAGHPLNRPVLPRGSARTPPSRPSPIPPSPR